MNESIKLILPNEDHRTTDLFAAVPRVGERVQLDKLLFGGEIGEPTYVVTMVVHVPSDDDHEPRVYVTLAVDE